MAYSAWLLGLYSIFYPTRYYYKVVDILLKRLVLNVVTLEMPFFSLAGIALGLIYYFLPMYSKLK